MKALSTVEKMVGMMVETMDVYWAEQMVEKMVG